MDRRKFVLNSGLSLGALALPDRLIADPYAPQPVPPRAASRLRIRGRVTGNGRALPGTRVSDGVTVVRTDADGRYTLVADGAQPFVFVSTPTGWQPARNPSGTARFYRPIDARRAEMEADFNLVPRPDDMRHSVLVLADPQTENHNETDLLHAETVPDVIGTVRDLGNRPVVGIACGDIMFDDLSLYPEWERAVQRMGVPFYQVLGNHDLDFSARTDERASETYGRHFGPTTYSFDIGAVHYVVLDDVFWHGAGYLGYVDARLLAWLAADLEGIERGAPVVVLQHIPPFSSQDSRRTNARNPSPGSSMMNREAVYRLLEPFRSLFISGHQHELEHVREGGPSQIVAGAVCGAWWSGPICYDGTPNGYLVLDAEGESLSWRYKGTGLARDHQLRVYGRGADPAAPDEVVANAWAWDRDWRITWIEDGASRGLMARRKGLDPLAVSLHTGPDLPPRRTWVDPMPTNHLFYATPSPTAKEIVVEARDAAGRVFRERIALAQALNGR